MKLVFIILMVLVLVFVAVQIFAMSSQRDIESYPFKVVKTYEEFEIRRYEASLFTSVKLSTNEYDKASSQGFSVLANYIFGGNKASEKIAMTSPVAMSLEDSMTMMFMVPKAIKKENLPQPNEAQIEFREEPEKIVAAVTFSGWADTEKIEDYKNQLTAALAAKGIAHTNQYYFLGYNPPYELLNRKNEVIVELRENYPN